MIDETRPPSGDGQPSRRALLAGATGLVGAGLALASAGIAGAATTPPPLQGTHVSLAGGRHYWLTGATSGATARPLLIGLHGTGQAATNANQAFWSGTGGWQAHAASAGYALALGEGVNGAWNPGGGWVSSNQDDLAYLLAVVADARTRVAVDPARVFVAGFSAGGAMAWTAVVERPEVFAACGSASGWAARYPRAPIDAWHIHGTADATVPIRGGSGTRGFVFPPALDEARLAPRGSRVLLYPTNGGHAVPGWMAATLWSYFTVDRLRP